MIDDGYSKHVTWLDIDKPGFWLGSGPRPRARLLRALRGDAGLRRVVRHLRCSVSPSGALIRQLKRSVTNLQFRTGRGSHSQLDIDVVDVGELDQPAGAAAAVLEVDLLEPLGGDGQKLVLGGALLLGFEGRAA
ncbi:hypothetical protein ABZ128_13490 [Streptomyces sp. NPDC006326]|uniref:hypothetical protein n=1 Tax=Streptomyces sp. NPDC006326 TaxID=3156752 RepID=UPI0033AB0880